MEDLEINKDIVIPSAELTMKASRSGGPGGQHANKTSTRVTLHWALADSEAISAGQRARLMVKLATHINTDGELWVHSGESRSQHRNREDARKKLAELVRKGLKNPKRRKKTKPSRRSQRRRVEEKRRRGRVKELRKDPEY